MPSDIWSVQPVGKPTKKGGCMCFVDWHGCTAYQPAAYYTTPHKGGQQLCHGLYGCQFPRTAGKLFLIVITVLLYLVSCGWGHYSLGRVPPKHAENGLTKPFPVGSLEYNYIYLSNRLIPRETHAPSLFRPCSRFSSLFVFHDLFLSRHLIGFSAFFREPPSWSQRPLFLSQ